MSIFNHFQHLTLSDDQKIALEKLAAFLESPAQVFMLKGYAGSGKTTILKCLAAYLKEQEIEFALMAPTGRAAKVIREKAGYEAFTIHKTIYSYDEMLEVENADIEGGKSFFYYYKIRNNTDVANKIFIVDEASMLSDAKSEGEFFRFGTGHLLSDLIAYTRVATPTAKSKIIFVGDPCQLAPVGDNSSKAFDPFYLGEKFELTIDEVEMKEVKRHGEESGILKSAAKIRKSLSAGFFNDFSIKKNGKDIFNPEYKDFLETYQNTAYPKIIIASKNKTCLDLNLQVRQMQWGDGNLPMRVGDTVIMGGNNYRKGIFNGEFAVVNEVSDTVRTETVRFYYNALKSSERNTKEVTLRWRKVELVFPDAETTNKIIRGQVLENFLYGDNYLQPEEMQALYVDFKSRHKDLRPKTSEFKDAIINDDYFNCLLLKYGYAVTCHKAQGGEWDNAFTFWDHDNRENFDCYVDEQIRVGKTNANFYRWAYTAVTRASKQLFAINPPCFNSYSRMAIVNTGAIQAFNNLTGGQLEPDEVTLDKELLARLEKFNLLEQPIPIQDHFIKVYLHIHKRYIDVVNWEKRNYEIWYTFKREGETASVKTWINTNNQFNGTFAKIPSQTNSNFLFEEIETVLKNLPNIHVRRNRVETIISKVEFDIEIEEQFPFTLNLFEDIERLLKDSGIAVKEIEHLSYRERYAFIRGQEKATIDFEYDKNGFWGRVLPLINQSNSQLLLNDVQNKLATLKHESYAC